MNEIKQYIFPRNSVAEQIQMLLKKILDREFGVRKGHLEIHLEEPNTESHGDYASNVAMAIAKDLGKNPREVAQIISENMKFAVVREDGSIEIENENDYDPKFSAFEVSIAGPGFLNFKINPALLKKELANIVALGGEYGRSDIGKGKKVMVEFGQPNTHKAFHVGHIRSAISGLAMVGLYKSLGYEVIKANYYGDVGMHVAKTIWGYLKKGGKPAGFDDINEHARMEYLADCYVFASNLFKEDPIAEVEIREINRKVYSKEDPQITEIYTQTRSWSLEHLNSVFFELSVSYDIQYPESSIFEDALTIVDKYKDEIFEESDGALIYDGKKEGLTTWVFLTKEKLPTYSAKDLGLAYAKFRDYDLDLGVVTTSVEQKDYFEVIIRALEKIRPDLKGKYKHVPFGWILLNNRKTSARMGGVIYGMDILKEVKEVALKMITAVKEYSDDEKKEISDKVGLAGLKFLILSHEFHNNINYEPEKFLSLSGFSGPYLLYTYARVSSILSQLPSKLIGTNNKEEVALDLEKVLNSEEELALLRTIWKFKEQILASALNLSPHLLCAYLYNLAQKFNKFYTEKSILNAENEQEKQARILLARSTYQLLRNGLEILGIETVERM